MRKFSVSELVTISAVVNEKQANYGLDFFKYGNGYGNGWYLSRLDCGLEHDSWYYHIVSRVRLNRNFFTFCNDVCDELSEMFGVEFDYNIGAEYDGFVLVFMPKGYFEEREREYRERAAACRAEREAERTTLGDIDALAALKAAMEKENV